MRTTTVNAALSALIAMILMALLSAGHAAESTDETTQEEVGKEVSEAMDAIQEYTVDQRDEALRQARSLLNDLDARIERREEDLREEWHRMTDAAKRQARTTLKVTRQKRDQIAEWYGGLAHSSDGAWGEIKKGFAAAYSELETAWEQAEREFKSRE